MSAVVVSCLGTNLRALLSGVVCAGLLATTGAVFVTQNVAAADADKAAANATKDAERATRAIATRQGALKLMGYYMFPLGGMARGRIPMDTALVAKNAIHIGNLAPMLTDTFKANTASSGVESDALPVIWAQPAKFQAKIEALVEGAAELNRVAVIEDVEEGAIKGAIGKLGQACGSCHDDFRVDDK